VYRRDFWSRLETELALVEGGSQSTEVSVVLTKECVQLTLVLRSVPQWGPPSTTLWAQGVSCIGQWWRTKFQYFSIFHNSRSVSYSLFSTIPSCSTPVDRADELNGKCTLFGRVMGDTIYSATDYLENQLRAHTCFQMCWRLVRQVGTDKWLYMEKEWTIIPEIDKKTERPI